MPTVPEESIWDNSGYKNIILIKKQWGIEQWMESAGLQFFGSYLPLH